MHSIGNKTESKFSPIDREPKNNSNFAKLLQFFHVFVNLIQFLTESKITTCMKSIYFYLCRKIYYAQNQFYFYLCRKIKCDKSIHSYRKQKINQFIQE